MGTRVPCYNRETIFDEEWQQHMKDVHGVFLLWPDSWMRRVEVLDLVSTLSPYIKILRIYQEKIGFLLCFFAILK
jgi:hypothetical protein